MVAGPRRVQAGARAQESDSARGVVQLTAMKAYADQNVVSTPGQRVAGDSRGREDYEMDVYFDNNALNDLQGLRRVSGDEVHRLRAAAKDRAITPKLSFVNIDEALAALVNHRPLALDLLRLIADFFGLDRMIKPPDRLLTDDFIDLAFGDPPRPAEIQMPAAIRQHLEALLRAEEGEIAVFVEAAAEARDQINELWEGLTRARDQARAEIGPSNKAQPFGEF